MKHRLSIVSKQLDNGNYDVAILVDGEVETVLRNICKDCLNSLYKKFDDVFN